MKIVLIRLIKINTCKLIVFSSNLEFLKLVCSIQIMYLCFLATPREKRMSGFFRTNRISLLTVLLLALFLSLNKINYQKTHDPIEAITWDVYGYYLYLPATFIYQDPGIADKTWLNKTFETYHPSPFLYQLAGGQKGRQVNVYPMGLAVIYAPGFLLAHLYALHSQYPADGFSLPYQWSLVLTGIAFLFLGGLLLRKLLLLYFPDKLVAALCVLTLLGTNYLFHAGYEGTMPHNFMFVLNCLILLLTIRWHENFRIKHAIALAFVLGLATISRPTELLWLLVPIFWGIKDADTLLAKIKLLFKNWAQVFVFALVLIATGFPQVLYWKYTTGYWRSYNHAEGFAFLKPYTIDFLFSYKKGWLVYTPLMLFAIAGFIPLLKKRKEIGFTLLLFFVLNLYVLSSWDCWWYAASFSQRPLVESYPMMAIPLGFLIVSFRERKTFLRFLLHGVLAICLALNLFQTWQFLHGIIDPEHMTKAYYWKVFGKTNAGAEEREFLEVDRENDQFSSNLKKFNAKELVSLDFDKNTGGVDVSHLSDTLGFESKRSLMLDTLMNFSPNITLRYDSMTTKEYVWVHATADVYPTVGTAVSNSSFVITMRSKGGVIKYRAFSLNDAKAQPGKWNKFSVYYITPYLNKSSDSLTAYYWNMGNKPVYIDNLKIEILEPRD
jgi:hypothetical protein